MCICLFTGYITTSKAQLTMGIILCVFSILRCCCNTRTSTKDALFQSFTLKPWFVMLALFSFQRAEEKNEIFWRATLPSAAQINPSQNLRLSFSLDTWKRLNWKAALTIALSAEHMCMGSNMNNEIPFCFCCYWTFCLQISVKYFYAGLQISAK